MRIIRRRIESGYTILPNQALRDERLSFRARGVLAYLLSMTDGWSCDSSSIAKQGREGRDAIRATLDELETVGYLVRETRRDEHGQFVHFGFLYDDPKGGGKPATRDGKPATGNPSSDDQAAIRRTNEEEPKEEPLGEGRNVSPDRARERPPTPKNPQQGSGPSPGGDEPSRFCPRHPDGTDYPCAACGEARRAFDQRQAAKADVEQQRRAQSRQFADFARHQPDCPHGVPGGDLPRPGTETPGCVACRHAGKAGLTDKPPDWALPDCPHGVPGGDWLTTTDGGVKCVACRRDGRQQAARPRASPPRHAYSRSGYEAASAALAAHHEESTDQEEPSDAE